MSVTDALTSLPSAPLGEASRFVISAPGGVPGHSGTYCCSAFPAQQPAQALPGPPAPPPRRRVPDPDRLPCPGALDLLRAAPAVLVPLHLPQHLLAAGLPGVGLRRGLRATAPACGGCIFLSVTGRGSLEEITTDHSYVGTPNRSRRAPEELPMISRRAPEENQRNHRRILVTWSPIFRGR